MLEKIRTPELRFISIVNLYDGYSAGFLAYCNERCILTSTCRSEVYELLVALAKALPVPHIIEGLICVGDLLADTDGFAYESAFGLSNTHPDFDKARENLIDAVVSLDPKVCFDMVDQHLEWTKVYMDGAQVSTYDQLSIEHHEVFDDNEHDLLDEHEHFLRPLAVTWPTLLISRKLLLSGFDNHLENFALVANHIKTVIGGNGQSFTESVVDSAIFALEQELDKRDPDELLALDLEKYEETLTALLNNMNAAAD